MIHWKYSRLASVAAEALMAAEGAVFNAARDGATRFEHVATLEAVRLEILRTGRLGVSSPARLDRDYTGIDLSTIEDVAGLEAALLRRRGGA